MVEQRRQAGDPLYEAPEDRESADEADAPDEVGEVGGERAPSTSGVGFARRRAEGEAGAAARGAEAGAGHCGEDGANGDASVGANGGDGSTGHEARRGANAISERRAGSTVPGGSACNTLAALEKSAGLRLIKAEALSFVASGTLVEPGLIP